MAGAVSVTYNERLEKRAAQSNVEVSLKTSFVIMTTVLHKGRHLAHQFCVISSILDEVESSSVAPINALILTSMHR